MPGSELGDPTFWEAAIGALGIDGGRPVVIYDDGRMTEAARVWFILQHFGIHAAVLNGGWPALDTVAGFDIEVGPAAQQVPVNFQARPGSGPVGLADRATVRAELGTSTQVFDARTAAEYAGTDYRKNARGGHLPGARHFAHADLLDPSGRLRTSGELRAVLEAAGFSPRAPIVTHCDGGGRAALAAIAALRAGMPDVRVYYLSFADWARDEICPIERPF